MYKNKISKIFIIASLILIPLIIFTIFLNQNNQSPDESNASNATKYQADDYWMLKPGNYWILKGDNKQTGTSGIYTKIQVEKEIELTGDCYHLGRNVVLPIRFSKNNVDAYWAPRLDIPDPKLEYKSNLRFFFASPTEYRNLGLDNYYYAVGQKEYKSVDKAIVIGNDKLELNQTGEMFRNVVFYRNSFSNTGYDWVNNSGKNIFAFASNYPYIYTSSKDLFGADSGPYRYGMKFIGYTTRNNDNDRLPLNSNIASTNPCDYAAPVDPKVSPGPSRNVNPLFEKKPETLNFPSRATFDVRPVDNIIGKKSNDVIALIQTETGYWPDLNGVYDERSWRVREDWYLEKNVGFIKLDQKLFNLVGKGGVCNDSNKQCKCENIHTSINSVAGLDIDCNYAKLIQKPTFTTNIYKYYIGAPLNIESLEQTNNKLIFKITDTTTKETYNGKVDLYDENSNLIYSGLDINDGPDNNLGLLEINDIDKIRNLTGKTVKVAPSVLYDKNEVDLRREKFTKNSNNISNFVFGNKLAILKSNPIECPSETKSICMGNKLELQLKNKVTNCNWQVKESRECQFGCDAISNTCKTEPIVVLQPKCNELTINTTNQVTVKTTNATGIQIATYCIDANRNPIESTYNVFKSATNVNILTADVTKPVQCPNEAFQVVGFAMGSNGFDVSDCKKIIEKPIAPITTCIPDNSCAKNTCSDKQCTNNCGTLVNGERNCINPVSDDGNKYVSLTGNDSNIGTYSSPYKSIQKCIDNTVGGKECRIFAGEYLNQPVNIINKSNIILSSVEGNKVVLKGVTKLNNWTRQSNNIYCTQTNINLGKGKNQLFINNNSGIEARWPNSDFQDISSPNNAQYKFDNNNQYLQYDNVPGCTDGKSNCTGSGWIIDETLRSFNPNSLVGANVNIALGPNWAFQTSTVTGNNGNKLELRYNNLSWQNKFSNTGFSNKYYLWGKKDFLDTNNEWYYNENTSELCIFSNTNINNLNIEIKTINNETPLIYVKDSNNIHIKNLDIFAGRISLGDFIGLDKASVTNSTISNITAKYIYHDINIVMKLDGDWFAGAVNHNELFYFKRYNSGITIFGDGNKIENSDISFSSGNGVTLFGNNLSAINNKIYDISYAGTDNAGITMSGSNLLIQYNDISRANRGAILGYNHSYTEGAINSKILSNYLHNVGLQNVDSGIYYSFGDPYRSINNEIAFNFMDTSKTEGALNNAAIYLDNNSKLQNVHHNITKNTWNGIMINGGISASDFQKSFGASATDAYNWTVVRDIKICYNTFLTKNYTVRGVSFGNEFNNNFIQNNLADQWFSEFYVNGQRSSMLQSDTNKIRYIGNITLNNPVISNSGLDLRNYKAINTIENKGESSSTCDRFVLSGDNPKQIGAVGNKIWSFGNISSKNIGNN